MFAKALIANRGEIACRLMRTMRRMGIRSVAVYSSADADAQHVKLADEAWPIGDAPARESYLRSDRIVETALRSGAEAVHPGYGFLSESAEFAERCLDAGLAFIGPSAASMQMVGNKSIAKDLAGRLGVPLIPGFHGEAQDVGAFAAAAETIGFPVVVKATAGGGGRGMRVVHHAGELAQAMESARREAILAFGDGRLLLEKYLDRPRHVEIQFVADAYTNVVTFVERDCSLQRRHQKIVEETPAPALSDALRGAVQGATVKIARAAAYVGAGTAEFLVAGESYYFLEVNARLQVEHPITEMVSGVDLVEWQFRVAAGEPLPLRQEEIKTRGCAIESRICAEDPARGFLPSSGPIEHLRLPHENEHVRLEVGVATGDVVSTHYDSLLAKLIVWDEQRADAVRQMQRALEAVELVGVASNLDLLKRLIASPSFVSGDFDTGVVEKLTDEPTGALPVDDIFVFAAAAAAWREDAAQPVRTQNSAQSSPWESMDGWRLFGRAQLELEFRCEGRTLRGRISMQGDGKSIIETDAARAVVEARVEGDRMALSMDGVRKKIGVVRRPAGYVLIVNGRNIYCEFRDPMAPSVPEPSHEKRFAAQLPSRVSRVLVKTGDRVAKGAPLLILEAMKMEIPLTAPMDGVVDKILCREGQSVSEGEELIGMEAADVLSPSHPPC